ncbi:MAG: glycine cleavage system protein GcvH [Dehalococcoidia bacterium]
MPSPNDRRYSKEHEWVLLRGDVAVVGITDYAQDQLGDIVYLDLPGAGTALRQFEKMGEIESVKAVSDLYAPLSGEVARGNDTLAEKPELVNSDPYGEGWLVELRPSDAGQVGQLMSAEEYDAFIAAEQRDEAIGP